MSYQAEERYWTDYLRIALPIIGLLLLLSVFWYWASSFIGDDNNEPRTPEAAVTTETIAAATVTPTAAQTIQITPETVDPTEAAAITIDPTEGPDDSTQNQVEPTATTEPVEQPNDNGEVATGVFTEGEIVVVNDIDVNLRSDPSTDSEIVDQLVDGTELRILDSTPVDDGEFTWWNVEDILTENQGWIAEFLIDKLE